MFVLALIPSMPKFAFFLASAATGALAYVLYKEEQKQQKMDIVMKLWKLNMQNQKM